MGLETASYIPELVPTNPVDSDLVGQGDDHLRLLKSVLQTQFPGLTAAPVNSSTAQLNALADYNTGNGTIEARLASLEAKNRIEALPSAAYDFNDVWWQQSAAEDEGRFFSANQVQDSQFDNAPWPWGANAVGGRTLSLFAQKFINNGQGVALNMLWRLSSNNGFADMYWRYSNSSAGLVNAKWMRSTYSHQTTEETPAVNTLFTSAKPELEDRGCTPCP